MPHCAEASRAVTARKPRTHPSQLRPGPHPLPRVSATTAAAARQRLPQTAGWRQEVRCHQRPRGGRVAGARPPPAASRRYGMQVGRPAGRRAARQRAGRQHKNVANRRASCVRPVTNYAKRCLRVVFHYAKRLLRVGGIALSLLSPGSNHLCLSYPVLCSVLHPACCLRDGRPKLGLSHPVPCSVPHSACGAAVLTSACRSPCRTCPRSTPCRWAAAAGRCRAATAAPPPSSTFGGPKNNMQQLNVPKFRIYNMLNHESRAL